MSHQSVTKTQYDGVHVISSSDDDMSEDEESAIKIAGELKNGSSTSNGSTPLTLPVAKDSPISRKIPNKSKIEKRQNARVDCVKFLDEATQEELCAIPRVSSKTSKELVAMRPFNTWSSALHKLNSHPHASISIDIMDGVVELLKSRAVVANLMSECERISDEISSLVKNIKQARHPKSLNPKLSLKGYQLIGLNWLVLMDTHKVNAILADEMGLGKTIQVIAFLAQLKEMAPEVGPPPQHLIVVPASTIDNWIREFELWAPGIKVLSYNGSQQERAVIRDKIKKCRITFEVCICTYNVLMTHDDKKLWKRCCFDYVVFDEAHMLKNMRSQRYQQLMKIDARHRILLTGTPLQNNLLELMSLLAFCMPNMFDARLSHITSIFETYTKDSQKDAKFAQERIDQARKIMNPFILRRLKVDVLKDLPNKEEILEKVPMTMRHAELYDWVREDLHKKWIEKKAGEITDEDLMDDDETVGTASGGGKRSRGGAGMLSRLRLAANHPLLVRRIFTDDMIRQMASRLKKQDPGHRDASEQLIFEDMEVMDDFQLHSLCAKIYPRFLAGYALDDSLIVDSGKFQYLDKLLPKLKEEGKKVLIFSQYVLVLNVIEDYLRIRGHACTRLDGSTKVSDRLDLIDNFNDPDSDLFVFLLTTRAGGMGINLTAASVVIIHDMDYNPYNDKQAEDRCHRVGQTKDVTVYRLMSESSIEEGIYVIAQNKLKLSQDLEVDKDGGDSQPKEDLKSLLRNALGV